MSHKGPDIVAKYNRALPIISEADSSEDYTGATIKFRIGVPGPEDGTVEDALVEQTLAVDDEQHASGTVPASDMMFDLGRYAYEVTKGVGDSCYQVSYGRLTLEAAPGRSA